MEDCDVHTCCAARGHLQPVHRRHEDQRPVLHQGTTNRADVDLRRSLECTQDHQEERPLSPKHFAEFEQCYGSDTYGRSARSEADSTEGRWRSFSVDEVKARHYKLDAFKWIRDEELDDPDDLPEPQELIADAMEELRLALDDLADLQSLIEADGNGATRELRAGVAHNRLEELCDINPQDESCWRRRCNRRAVRADGSRRRRFGHDR